MLGAGLIPLAIIGSVVIGVMLLVFVNRKSNETSYVLVLQCDSDASESAALARVEENVKRYVIKSKTVGAEGVELTVEIRIKDAAAKFVNGLLQVEGVKHATLVSYNGEYMS